MDIVVHTPVCERLRPDRVVAVHTQAPRQLLKIYNSMVGAVLLFSVVGSDHFYVFYCSLVYCALHTHTHTHTHTLNLTQPGPHASNVERMRWAQRESEREAALRKKRQLEEEEAIAKAIRESIKNS